MALKHLDKMSPRMKKALSGKCVMTYRLIPEKPINLTTEEKKSLSDEPVKKSEENRV
jgi:hypothetical protein